MAQEHPTPAREAKSSFVPHSSPMDAADVQRMLWRMASEIVERNRGTESLVILGMQSDGVKFARRLAENIAERHDGAAVPVGSLDMTLHRDDLGDRPFAEVGETHLPVSIDDKVVVLVDDVLFTGRTARAAIDALLSHGRPAAVRLAVIVDRGHREVPIRPDFVGKNLPTRRSERVEVSLGGVQIGMRA